MSRPRWRRSIREPPPHRGGPRAWLASLVLNHHLKKNPRRFSHTSLSCLCLKWREPPASLRSRVFSLFLFRFKISKTRPHVFSTSRMRTVARDLTALYLPPRTRPTVRCRSLARVAGLTLSLTFHSPHTRTAPLLLSLEASHGASCHQHEANLVRGRGRGQGRGRGRGRAGVGVGEQEADVLQPI